MTAKERNLVNNSIIAAVSAVAFALVNTAYAHNGPRVYFSVEGTRLVTGLDQYLGAHNITPGVSVFRGTFGADPENSLPGFTQFPGISGAVSGPTAVPAGSSISFGIAGPVTYWDGTGAVAFGPSPETISVSAGLNVATSGAGPVDGFTVVASVPSSDGWHTHPGYTLNPDGLGQYWDGVFVLPLTFTNGALTPAPAWLVFGQNVSDATLTQAVTAVTAAVPEPTSLAVLGTGLLLLAKRRDHSRTREVQRL
jgi:hypothetical protein